MESQRLSVLWPTSNQPTESAFPGKHRTEPLLEDCSSEDTNNRSKSKSPRQPDSGSQQVTVH